MGVKGRREIGWGLRLLLAGLLILSAGGWLRMALAISNRILLRQIGIYPLPVYIAVTGGVVGVLAGLGFWVLAADYWWASRAVKIIAVILAAGYWAVRLLFTQSSAAQANWLFMLVITLILLVFTFMVLGQTARR